ATAQPSQEVVMLRLLTDFNDIDDGDIVTGLARDLIGPNQGTLDMDEWVVLHDDGEHEALGKVSRVQGDLIFAQIVWDTWGSEGRLTIPKRGENTRTESAVTIVGGAVSRPPVSGGSVHTKVSVAEEQLVPA